MDDAKEALVAKLTKLYARLLDSYEGCAEAVEAVIEECHALLRDQSGELGPWEAAELDYAETAVKANFLRLGLVCVDKAIRVNCLPAEEYEHGYNYQGYRWVSPSP